MVTQKLDKLPVVSMHLIAEGETTTASNAHVVRFVSPADPSESQTLHLIEQSGTLDFWSAECEDGYTGDDGESL